VFHCRTWAALECTVLHSSKTPQSLLLLLLLLLKLAEANMTPAVETSSLLAININTQTSHSVSFVKKQANQD